MPFLDNGTGRSADQRGKAGELKSKHFSTFVGRKVPGFAQATSNGDQPATPTSANDASIGTPATASIEYWYFCSEDREYFFR